MEGKCQKKCMEVFKSLESSEYFILSIFPHSYTEAIGGLVEASPVYTGWCYWKAMEQLFVHALASCTDVLVVVSLELCLVFK